MMTEKEKRKVFKKSIQALISADRLLGQNQRNGKLCDEVDMSGIYYVAFTSYFLWTKPSHRQEKKRGRKTNLREIAGKHHINLKVFFSFFAFATMYQEM